MRFLIISHVLHKEKGNHWFAYAPYVREMNLWLKYVDEVEIVAPSITSEISTIDLAYQHKNIHFTKIPAIAFINLKTIVFSILVLPQILFCLFKACRRADHIHLRCPGNIGLLGCLVQILFPKKIKTAKYAGNWDPKAKQPISYKIQKWILRNINLTKNIKVLVYGEWKKQSKNIKPFFTASFNNSDKEDIKNKSFTSKLKFVFVGSLVEGKRPGLSIEIVEMLNKFDVDAVLDVYGDGVLRRDLEAYVKANGLTSIITFKGNRPIGNIKKILKESHFLILPSKSEGWPKSVAEAMFYGVIPIVTPVSCVAEMLDYGKRGILIEANCYEEVKKIINILNNEDLNKMSKLASIWSQKYTLEYFESEIKKIFID